MGAPSMTECTGRAHLFKLSEFTVASELAFEFAHTRAIDPDPSCAPRPDLRIALGPTPERLAAPSWTTENWQVERDRRFLLTAPGIGRFLLERGGAVRIEPFCDPDRIELRLYCLGTVFAAWLAMHGFVPLHAGAAATGAGAALVCGRSGAGKSTTMALLARAGRPVLAEDLAILEVRDRVDVLALSGQIKLEARAVDALGIDRGACRPIPAPRRKYAVPTARASGRWPVRTAVVLHPPGAAAAPSGPSRGAFAVRTLMNQVYRPRLAGRIMGRDALMARIAHLADAVDVVHVRRSADYALSPEMAAALDIACAPGRPP